FSIVFRRLVSEGAAAEKSHGNTVAAVPLRLYTQSRSAGCETKNRTVRPLGRGQPHRDRYQGSFAYHPFQAQVQTAGAQVLKYGLFLEGLIVYVYPPQPRGVGRINSRTRPSFLHQL